ncbi:hypothetical protein LARV_03662 [Longilinea arvoryzae]|uniref:DUF2267 domain-containing protein n=1 Tax=Longilinea arvoryzae TaxID=360412 RepID=A0A0S7BD91_9CHLR|nr:hypothetical protein [Longilinea arvoryzae]GAP15868.1 hypothetical protein LARV_03662 [Longilinea arvoryzae]
MDELVKLVSKKTGIPEQTARVAVETVLNFIKQKLPAPIAGQIDALLKGESQGGDVLKGLGDLLGK